METLLLKLIGDVTREIVQTENKIKFLEGKKLELEKNLKVLMSLIDEM